MRKRKTKLQREWEVFIRWLTGGITILTPLASIPQIKQVWSGNSEGVSITTWLMLGISSFVWLIYGITIRERRVVIKNLFDSLARIAIIFGSLR